MPRQKQPKKTNKEIYAARIASFKRRHPNATKKQARGYHRTEEIKQSGYSITSEDNEEINFKNKNEMSKYGSYINDIQKAAEGDFEVLDQYKGEYVRDDKGDIIYLKNGDPKIKGHYWLDNKGKKHLFVTDEEELYQMNKKRVWDGLEFHSEPKK